MYVDAILFFLAVSLSLYLLLAGADFGAGIVELLVRKKNFEQHQKIISKAVGPVWEANHIWLILAVVISFVAFPKLFSHISIKYHIPLTLMIFGIVLRGCAFTFRIYDVVKDKSHFAYSMVFQIASLITPFAMGLIAGSMISSTASENPKNFLAFYVQPWLTPFSLGMGFFTTSLCVLLASSYLIGESFSKDNASIYRTIARRALIISVILGGLIFIIAELENLQFLKRFFQNPWATLSIAIATCFAGKLYFDINRKSPTKIRISAAVCVTCILCGWFALQYPFISIGAGGAARTFHEMSAGETTLKALLYGLCFGSLIIFPGLFYLLTIFKRQQIR